MGNSFRTRTGLLVDELGPALLADITITGFTWHFGLLLRLVLAECGLTPFNGRAT
jgi:hypothetical protein